MPNQVHPVAPLPDDVAAAYQLVKSPLRIVLLGWLREHPDALVSEIVAGIGGERNAVRSNLHDLEALGVLRTSIDTRPRERRRVRYRLQNVHLSDALDTLINFLRPNVDAG